MLDQKLKSMDIFQPKTSYLSSLVLFMIYICDTINVGVKSHLDRFISRIPSSKLLSLAQNEFTTSATELQKPFQAVI